MAKSGPVHDTTKTTVDKPAKQAAIRHNEFGEEILDPIPMQPPLGYKKQLSLTEQIRQQVRLHALSLEDNSITENDEEADDFDVGDDYEPSSPYEEIFEGDVLRDAFALQNMKNAAEKAAAVQEGKAAPPAPNPPQAEKA